jgi:hypothetical protein
VTDREFLRHTLATLAYRAAKTMRGAPDSFATFKAGPSSKTPMEIVGHMADLMAWGYAMATGPGKWVNGPAESWKPTCERFFAQMKAFDDLLASNATLDYDLTRLFQGPVADALTHTGQLAMLRRLHGAPMKGESYNRADIKAGRVGAEQTPADPKFEFD